MKFVQRFIKYDEKFTRIRKELFRTLTSFHRKLSQEIEVNFNYAILRFLGKHFGIRHKIYQIHISKCVEIKLS